MALILRKLNIQNLSKVPVRYKNSKDHWSVIRKKVAPKDKALEHFDDFYTSIYGVKSWEKIRQALLCGQSKYMAVLNNFSDIEKVEAELTLLGALNVKTLYDIQLANMNEFENNERNKKKPVKNNKKSGRVDKILSNAKVSEIQSVVPGDYDVSEENYESNNSDQHLREINQPLANVELRPLEADLENASTIDFDRIVSPEVGSNALHEYIPATKLKGMEEYMLESDHYDFYRKGADFSVNVEKENILDFPEYLKIYTYEMDSEEKFRSPKRGSTGVLDYYLLDGASILPVLALGLKPGDAVLDMCGAPGGKALSILQTLTPRLMVINDSSSSRVNRIKSVLDQYVAGIGKWDDKLFVTHQDARTIQDKDVYNKILVDVPCTTDRHTLHNDENNLFKSTRLKERLQIPELQTEILVNALKLVAVGGTVVYSTCTLSPIQNDGVVQMALKKVWEESANELVVKDLYNPLKPLRSLYKFGNYGLKYGHIAIPTLHNNWGPMYFCKIVRVR